MRILGLIPARGGSKGMPKKNVRPIAGKSLIERAFEAARESEVLDRIILSTDEPEAASIARGVGLEVPFVRPAALASDEVGMIDVVLHALDALEDDFDAVMVLQPTSPLRSPSHIRDAVRMLEATPKASGVCSVTLVPPEQRPHYLVRVDIDGWLRPFMPDGWRYVRRQDTPPAHRRCGTIFLTRTSVLRGQRSFYGETCIPMELDAGETLNIDGPLDWAEAERRLAEPPREKSA